MTKDEAIKSLLSDCEDLTKMIDTLKEQNNFLTETICRYNLQNIAKERQELIDRAEKADMVKMEFTKKQIHLDSIAKELEFKKNELDSLIAAEAEKLTAGIKEKYSDLCKKNNIELCEYKITYEKLLKDEREKYKRKCKKYLILSIMFVIMSISTYILLHGM